MSLNIPIRKASTLILVALCSLICVHAQHQTRSSEKPNLLFIMADQFRYDALSIAGNTTVETPNLDRLAESGVIFRNAYTPMAVCGPARASILTGCSVENTGVNTNDKTYGFIGKVMTMPTFDERLTEAGYHCEYYGKWHALSSKADVYRNPIQKASNGRSVFGPGGQAFMYRDYLDDHSTVDSELIAGQFEESISNRPYESEPIDKYHGYTAQELKEAGLQHSQPDQHGELQLDSGLSITAFQAQQTLDAIDRLKDTTFSITCSFHFPHSPITPTEPYFSMYPVDEMDPPVSIDDPMNNSPYVNTNGRKKHTEYQDPEKIKYMISNYYGLVKEIDDWVGKMMDKLEKEGILDNTMIIFTSDHGEMLGAHGMREKNVFYEESAHIPLLISYPDQIPSNKIVEGYTSLVDLFPTILDYHGQEVTPCDGQSLRDLIENKDTSHGDYVVTEWDYRGPSEPNYMVVNNNWKLITSYGDRKSNTHALYHLETDPYEMNNLIGSNPNAQDYIDKVNELRADLVKWLEHTNSDRVVEMETREIVQGDIPVSKRPVITLYSDEEELDGQSVCLGSKLRAVASANFESSDWVWEGPDGLSVQSNSVTISDSLLSSEIRNYTVSYTNMDDGMRYHSRIELTNNGQQVPAIDFKVQVNGTEADELIFCEGDILVAEGRPVRDDWSWEWRGPNDYFSTKRQNTITGSAQTSDSGEISLTATSQEGCSANVTRNIEVQSKAICILKVIESDKTMLVKPNPTTEVVTLVSSFFPSGKLEVIIFDAQGRELTRKFFDQERPVEIDMSTYQVGEYFISVKGDNYSASSRVIKTSL